MNNVVVNRPTVITGDGAKINILVKNSDGTIQWADFSDTDFVDWGSANYSSYLESRHTVMDPNIRATSPYIVVYLGVTETGWVLNAAGDGYDPVRPTSALVSTFWDWKTSASSSTQQAYRLKHVPVVDLGDLNNFGYPFTVLQTRLKTRGRGRSMRVRIESEQGKDFELLGWGMIGARNDRF